MQVEVAKDTMLLWNTKPLETMLKTGGVYKWEQALVQAVFP